ncbi:MAG: glycosyltransferase [Aquisalimonadaceae bacterium]
MAEDGGERPTALEPVMSKPRMMAVLYSFDTGGSERMAVAVIRHLQAEGYHVDVCATHSAGGPIAGLLEAGGLRCFGVDVETLSRLGRRRALYRLFRERRVEVLYVQHLPMMMLCYWPARLAGVRRIVVTEHTDEQLRTRPLFRWLARRHVPRVDAVTVIHSGLRESLAAWLGMQPRRIAVVPNGVDTAQFRPHRRDPRLRAEMGAGSGMALVGCVARLHTDKDHRTLLTAMAHARERQPDADFRLVLIGDGPERAALESLARRLRLTSGVTFLGDRSDVDRLMPQLDLLVLSSRTEGLPLVLLEAMACGVPCVATAVGGIPELLRNGGGRLVPPEDPAALAETIAALLSAPQTLIGLGRQARRVVMAGHDRLTMVHAYQRILDPRATVANAASPAAASADS